MDYPGKVITKTQVTPTQTSASGNWTLDDQAAAIKNNNWPVALVPNPISKSLRFNSADNAFLNRTPASASNRKTWTWSGWVKRSKLGAQQGLIGCPVGTSDSTFMNLQFNPSDQLGLGLYTQYVLLTTQVFRDTSAWYHIVVAFNTTNATADNRCRMYVNGVEITTFTSRSNPTLNADYGINQASQHDIGRSEYTNSTCLGGYLTEINFIDGQALTPSDFGLTNPQTGQWIPKKYTGTYGTNGFYLNFKDATSTTTLGYDYSGNANNWTTNNFSVTAGSGNDSLTDVPTPWVAYNTTGDVGGVIRGNYCTWNPLRPNAAMSYANGNLDATSNGGSGRSGYGTFGMSSGKWYFETTGGDNSVGIATISESVAAKYSAAGSYDLNGTTVSGKATYTTTDLIGCAYDATNGTIEFFKNGVSQGSSSFSAGLGLDMVAQFNGTFSATRTCVANFGQRPFAYTPPAGFRSLCTTNLPATTIGFGLTNQGDDYFNTVLYTGNGFPTTGTQTITGLDFQPDFVWIKDRSRSGYNNFLQDVLRGSTNVLRSNTTGAANTESTAVTSFNSNGFSLGDNNEVNYQNDSFVSWNWKAGGTGVTNTAGSITSTVSANTTAGFSIVTYTGNGSSGATIGHGLGVAPSMFIVKSRGTTDSWGVYHASLGNTKGLYLETTGAAVTSSAFWNNTSPTSTVFSVSNNSINNASSTNYVAYCFAAVAGYSAFGSYTGNGSTDGPFIYLGFRARYVMVKNIGATGWWTIYDTARDPANDGDMEILAAQSSSAGGNQLSSPFDIVSNGFKVRSGSTSSDNNSSGVSYIYAAFAESPFQFANAR